MSMKEIGKGLLSEVEECDLSEVLNALHFPKPSSDDASARAAHVWPTFDIPIPELHTLFSTTPPATAPIIDLSSTHPLSGKTTLLYHAVAHAVMPRARSLIDPGVPGANTHTDEATPVTESRSTLRAGRGGTAVVVDNDANFSVTHLVTVMRAFLLSSSPTSAPKSTTSVDPVLLDEPKTAQLNAHLTTTIHHALRHIHVLQPTSLPSLVATLESLPAYLLSDDQKRAQHHSHDRPLTLLAVDNATAFYYTARADAESAIYSSESQAQSEAPPAKAVTGANLANALQTFRRVFARTPILLTSTSLPPSTSVPWPGQGPYANDRGKTGLRSLLQPAHMWDRILTQRFVLERAVVPRFKAEIGIPGAERDREARVEVVRRGRVVVRSLAGERIGKEVEIWVGERGLVR